MKLKYALYISTATKKDEMCHLDSYYYTVGFNLIYL